MKMLTATRVAALAVGLSLAGGQAFADDGQHNRGQRDKDNNTATDQQDPNADGDRNRRGQKKKEQVPPAAAPAPAVTPAVQPTETGRVRDRNRRGANDYRRGYNRQAPVATPMVQPTEAARVQDRNRRDANDNRRGRNDQINDRRNDNPYARNDNRRDWNDNDRRKWGKQDRRRFDVKQHRRNVNAHRRFQARPYHWNAGYSYQRYGYGQRIPRHFFGRNFWLSNYWSYGLFAPPPGYIWVRYGPDALLIDLETGEIVQVQYNMFYS